MTDLNPTLKKPEKEPEFFETFGDVKKGVSWLKPPTTDQAKIKFLEKLNRAPARRYFAFRLLMMVMSHQRTKELNSVASQLVGILSAGFSPLVELEKFASPKLVEAWVQEQFPPIATQEEANQLWLTEKHLWVLYQIFRAWNNRVNFMAGIAEFAVRVEVACFAGSVSFAQSLISGKPQRNFQDVVRALAEAVPTKPKSIGGLLVLLKAYREWALYPQDLQASFSKLQKEKQALEQTVAQQAQEIETTKNDLLTAQQKAAEQAETSKGIQKTSEELKASLDLQAGIHRTELLQAASRVLGDLRRTCNPKLEDIRLYANRDEPNKEAILRKVTELETILKNYGQQTP